ncbi:YXWGXW repeat-containing protein [Pseudoduganella rivuli]|nr:YXWGXW repeat-containing protein [Pseudoduganella rivuli]
MIKPTLYACALLAISSAAFAPAQALAQVDVNLVIGNAPPPPRFESIPQPRRGYVWVPGYWNWNGHRHVWTSGHWEPERLGYQYRPSTWVREADGWRMEPGTWISLNGGNVRVDYATVPPPPPRYEVIPAPRPGYVWSAGFWEWRGNRHEWVPGHWLAERPGFVYTAPRWTERDGRWVREDGRWDRYERHARYNGRDRDRDGIPDRYERHGRDRDRDHDGIPDRHDRDRDNDGVPNRYDRDRDGDGVPNRYDEHPDNPRRR